MAQTPSSLVVVTYNVESDADTNPDRVADTIATVVNSTPIPPALWGFSEVPDTAAANQYAAAAGNGFEVIVGTTGNSDKLAIAYDPDRLKLVDGSVVELTNSGGSRAPLVAEFEVLPGGPAILVVDNHFNRGSEDRRNAQARFLRGWIEERTQPVIALGDFNFDYAVDLDFVQPSNCRQVDIAAGNEAFQIFTTSDAIRWIEPDCLNDPMIACPPTGTACDPCFNSILDFVFLAAAAKDWPGRSQILRPRPDYCEVEGAGGADHYPVLAAILIDTPAPEPFPTSTAEPSPRPNPTPPMGSSPGMSLVISGLLPNPSGQESLNEEVLLKNTGDVPIDLDGWTLRDCANNFWVLGDRVVAPGETIQMRRLMQPLALNNDGDTVSLVAPDGRVIDEVSYGRARKDEFFSFDC